MNVTAVMKNLPKNTILNAQSDNELNLICLFSDQFERYHVLMNRQSLTNWTNNPFNTFLRIKKGANVDEIAKKVTTLQSDERMLSIRSFSLLPLINKHLYTLRGEPAGIRTVYMFQWIALVILVIACINYVNLMTARASKRHREIGIRKIVGANTFNLFLHLIVESVILFIISIIVAYIMNRLLLPIFNSLSGKKIEFGLFDPNVWRAYFVIFLTIVALAGIYPAYLLASFRETSFTKYVKSKQGGNYFRQILVVTQFVASTILVAVTVTLMAQMNFLRRKDIGYNRENVMISMLHGVQPQHQYEVFKSELESYPSVLGATRSDDVITSITSINSRFDNWEGKVTDGSLTFRVLCCDTSYVRVMGLTIIDGTDFTSTSTGVIYSDNATSGSTTRTATYTEKQYIINETAARAMGLKDPVGKWVIRPEWRIVGIVKDFHFESYHKPIEPLVMIFDPVYAWALHLRYRSGEVTQAIDALRNVWMKYKSDYPFSYWFLDGAFDTLYQKDAQTNRLFTTFSIIAIFISCLGLFGLVVFTAEMKTKEIGIRKVHGAGIFDITNLMLRGFLLLVGIAILIAIPLSYYLSSSILQRFAYRIPLSWWIFVFSGIITVLLTLLTVSWIAVKSATKNP
jgi:ABC-type antimicrobial peptide transport system permease subunit